MKYIFLLIVLVTASCNLRDDDGFACTQEAIAGLNVTVRDVSTQAYLSENVSVLATESSYSETLELLGTNPPVFVGAWERKGTYVITVTAAGYGPYTSQPLTVTADRCHVIPQQVEILLQPE